MPDLHVNHTPKMTAFLVGRGVFRDAPLVVADIGARGGVESYWEVFGQDIRIVAFEVDAEECARLNEGNDRRVRYLPHALGHDIGPRTLYVANHSPSSSFHKPNPAYHARYLDRSNLETLREITVQTTTLPVALAANGIPTPDFIKIDVEGAELEILQGAAEVMRSPDMLGLVTEVRFTSASSGCPLFWEMERYAREVGLELYDLDTYRHSKRALPYPYLYDFRDSADQPIAGCSIQGQILWGDALYLRDYAGHSAAAPQRRKLVALACLYEIFGLNDCAAELLLQHRATFEEIAPVQSLLDLLVPEAKSKGLSYAEYMNRNIVTDPLLRPTWPRRYPEAIVANYDGRFVPSWVSKWWFGR